MSTPRIPAPVWLVLLLAWQGVALARPPQSQPAQPAQSGKEVYEALKAFQLGGGTSVAENLTLTRDRAQMTFNGTFYFEAPIAGRIHGAVFIGNGRFKADAPPLEYEKENIQRLLHADNVESDFRTAVLRFTDDTLQTIGGKLTPSVPASPDAQKLADEFEPRFLKQTAVNVSARLAVSILNQEQPGFFLAQFDKGDRGRFTFLYDEQERVPAASFQINAGEKGLIFAHNELSRSNDVWMAFYSLQDFKNGRAEYSDLNDLVKIENYKMDLDVRDPRKELVLHVVMSLKSRKAGLRAIPFSINEALGEEESERLKKAMRLAAAFYAGGKQLEAAQEEWDGGVTVFLPEALPAGTSFDLSLGFTGDFLEKLQDDVDCYYPRETLDWFPRHGYMSRSTYNLVFHHKKDRQVVSVGEKVREEPDPDDSSAKVTEWKIDKPISGASFAVGRFQTYTDTPKVGDVKVPIVLYYPEGKVKADFVVAEMGNALGFFSFLFGPYEYKGLDAVYFPGDFGQGLPTLLLLPKADWAVGRTFQFIAHETSHQWWGDMVAWRSYRDQWLSEGFADYSGLLYTRRRQDAGSVKDMMDSFHFHLMTPAVGEMGFGKGPVANIGPLILGHRLSTRASYNGYTTLIYEKGAMVLRMLHFLFMDPQTREDKAFYDMMTDFVNTHRDGWASTEDFISVANRHFASTPIARKYRMTDLNWFFREWVYEAHLPSYRLEYREEPQANGSVLLRGTIFQENVPKDFAMPLPLVLHFGKDKVAVGTIVAYGPQQPVSIPLPSQPSKVELDPDSWVLSEKTSEKSIK